jgi:hypothetical protein
LSGCRGEFDEYGSDEDSEEYDEYEEDDEEDSEEEEDEGILKHGNRGGEFLKGSLGCVVSDVFTSDDPRNGCSLNTTPRERGCVQRGSGKKGWRRKHEQLLKPKMRAVSYLHYFALAEGCFQWT